MNAFVVFCCSSVLFTVKSLKREKVSYSSGVIGPWLDEGDEVSGDVAYEDDELYWKNLSLDGEETKDEQTEDSCETVST